MKFRIEFSPMQGNDVSAHEHLQKQGKDVSWNSKEVFDLRDAFDKAMDKFLHGIYGNLIVEFDTETEMVVVIPREET